MKKIFIKLLKTVAWIIAIMLGVFLLAVISLQIPTVQNFAKNKVVSYLHDKIKTEVYIGKVEIGLPKIVILNDVYFADQNNDTLLSGKKLAVNINLLDLIDSNVIINSIDLKGVVANVNRDKKGRFNFDYIIDAFATPTKSVDTTTTLFSIKDINLDDVQVKFDDAISKNDLTFKLKHFDTKIEKFDLNKMDFSVPKITISGLKLNLNQGIAEAINAVKEESEKQIEENYLKLNVGTIDLKEINVNYISEDDKLSSKIKFEKLQVDFNKLDLQNQKIDIQKIDLINSDSEITFGQLEKKIIIQKTIPNEKVATWEVKLNKVNLKKINFKYNDQNSQIINKGLDYGHLNFKNLNLNATEINYSVTSTSGIINTFSAQEKSGLIVNQLNTNFLYTEKQSYLKKLYLKTPKSEIKDEIIVFYNSLTDLQNKPENTVIDAKLRNSKLAFSDLLLVAPQLKEVDAVKNYPNAIVNVNAIVLGKLNKLAIKDFQFSGLGNSSANINGSITGLPNYETALFNLNIKNLKSTKKDVLLLSPKNSIPSTIDIPNSFIAQGKFKGSIANFFTNLNVSSDFGNAKLNANYDQRITDNEKYNAQLNLINFNVGKLIKNNQIGKITGNFSVKGQSLNPNKANAVVDAKIENVFFTNYNYQSIDLSGKINNGKFNTALVSKDKNLILDLAASGDFNKKYPTSKFVAKLDLADLNKLNLHAGPLKIRGDFVADFQSLDLDYLNGSFSGSNLYAATETEKFPIDSIYVSAISTSENNSIQLESQFANASINGKYKLSQIGDALINSVSKYYNLKTKTSKVNDNQQFVFDFEIKDDPIIYKLVPDIKSISAIKLSGKYNSINDSIVINGTIPNLIYQDYNINNGILKIENKEKSLNYSLVIGNIKNAQFELPYSQIIGKLEDDLIEYVILLKDAKNADRYKIGGTFEDVNNNSVIKLDGTNLILNYDQWNLSNENEIKIGANGIFANNFELSKGNNKIILQSDSNSKNAPLNVELNNFDLITLSSFVKSDFEVSGLTSGKAQIKDLTSTPLFTSDLNVENFKINNDTIGNLSLQVNNNVANVYNAKIALSGNKNDVKIDGVYKTGNSSFDMNAQINQLNMQSIQGFSLGNLKESSGYIKGNLKATGTVDAPLVNGSIRFVEAGFIITPLNSTLKLINDEIKFNNQAIVFTNFKFLDENDNKLVIDGKINSQDYTNLGFALNIKANNFKAVNSTSKDNPDYYGELFLNNNINIGGTMNNPVVDGRIKINKDTKFTIVLPQDDPSIADRQGIVEFIDRDAPKLITISKPFTEMNQSAITGINASLIIEVDKDAAISIVIDKANGDFIKLQGEAQLTGGIDPSGKTSLTGRYEFTAGQYEMNINLIKRKFDIKPGSYILWTGEPTSAETNITAIYKSETAPIDLLNDQLAGISDQERNTYKQKIPFETELKMNGELLKPTITFDIVLPEGNNDVSTSIINTTTAKLEQLRQDPQELNKQVFALLLLNRFIGENPFKSETGGITASALARQSASRILSEQLNNFAGDLIKGFELDFNVDSSDEYSTGEKNTKTDLNVGLSKKLLNDRLKVTIGSNVGLEGTARTNEQSSTFAGDLSADYLLTKDGRYKVRAYRKNRYQVALEGQVIETGIGFIITMDYNKFSELFKKSKKKNGKK